MTLWTKNDAQPCGLPEVDYDVAGRAWTHLAENPEGRTACGWAEAPERPTYDAATQDLAWAGGAWSVVDRPAAPPQLAPQQRLKPVGLFLTSIPFSKLVAIKAAEASDPVVGACLEVVRSLDQIDMLDPHTAGMLGALQQKNYLTAPEVAAILAA